MIVVTVLVVLKEIGSLIYFNVDAFLVSVVVVIQVAFFYSKFRIGLDWY